MLPKCIFATGNAGISDQPVCGSCQRAILCPDYYFDQRMHANIKCCTIPVLDNC